MDFFSFNFPLCAYFFGYFACPRPPISFLMVSHLWKCNPIPVIAHPHKSVTRKYLPWVSLCDLICIIILKKWWVIPFDIPYPYGLRFPIKGVSKSYFWGVALSATLICELFHRSTGKISYFPRLRPCRFFWSLFSLGVGRGKSSRFLHKELWQLNGMP